VLEASWWRRLKLLLGGVQREDDCKLLEALYNYDTSLVANSGLSEDSFKGVQKSAKAAFQRLLNTYRPWAAVAEEDAKNDEANRYREAYKALIGDLDDPEFIRSRELANIKADALEELELREDLLKAAEKALTDDEYVTKRRDETARLLAEIAKNSSRIP